MATQHRRLARPSLAVLALFALVLTACGQAPGADTGTTASPEQDGQAADERVVIVHWYPGLLGANLRAAFAETYEGASVAVIESFDNARFTEMQATSDQPAFDVGMFIDPLMPLVAESELIEPLDPSAIPNLESVDPLVRIDDDTWAVVTYGSWGIAYNADEVTEPITSWRDLLREDLSGRVSAPNITYNSSLYTLDALARLEGGSLQDPERGFELMQQVRSNGPGLWDSESVAVGWLKTGEIWATPYFSGNVLALQDDPDVPNLEFVVPEEGAYFVSFNVVNVANSPNPGSANAFINHMLSVEAQEAWAEIGKARPVNVDADVPEEVERTVPPADELIHLDWVYFAENRDEIVSQWEEIVNR